MSPSSAKVDQWVLSLGRFEELQSGYRVLPEDSDLNDRGPPGVDFTVQSVAALVFNWLSLKLLHDLSTSSSVHRVPMFERS